MTFDTTSTYEAAGVDAHETQEVGPEAVPAEGDEFGAGVVEITGFRFARSSDGLSQTEVAAVIGQLVRRTKALEDSVNEAKETVAHIESMRRYGEQTVKAADTIAEQIRQEAEQQAVVIRERAQQEARKIVADARTQHGEIVRSASERAREVADQVAQLLQEQSELNRRMADLVENAGRREDEPANSES